MQGPPATPRRLLRSIRLLAQCYQAFERLSAAHVRALGLTPPQFDIVATLGNTAGMSFRELGERTLITKGTLTGVVDRLEARALVRRTASPVDGRSTVVRLTEAGERLFERVFPEHMAHVGRVVGGLGERDLDALDTHLAQLRAALGAPQDEPRAATNRRSPEH